MQVMDGAEPRWVCTTVNLDDHIIVPDLDRAAITADPDKALEDYVASLSTLPLACTRSAADPRAPPAMPSAQPAPPPSARRKQGRRVYGAPPRPAWSAGALALAAWVLACAVLAWNTVVDVARFVAMALQLVRDPPTVFAGVEFRRKRFVMRTLSLDDVKLVKQALGCVSSRRNTPCMRIFILLPFYVLLAV